MPGVPRADAAAVIDNTRAEFADTVEVPLRRQPPRPSAWRVSAAAPRLRDCCAL